MQKTLAFLEQNVQWLALGLAGIFLVFCVYMYVLTPPAVVKLGTRPNVPASEVDDIIKNGPVKEINRQRTQTTDLVIAVPDVVTPWQKQIDAPTVPKLALDWSHGLYPPGGKIQGPGREGPSLAMVTELPSLPKAQPQTPATGLSVVAIPNAPAGPNGGGAPAVPVANNQEDLEWVTVAGTIPKDFADAFTKVLAKALANKGANGIEYTTAVLRVELQRQRATGWSGGNPVFPNGNDGVETVPVPRLMQADLKPLPDPKASIQEKVSYADWAEKSVELITQPKFYDVRGGTPWPSPAAANAGGGAGAAAAPAPGGAGARGLAGIPPAMPPRVAQPAPGFNPGGAAGAQGRNAGQINPAQVTQDMLVWAHDDSVKSGQTYRYRFIYHMKNPVLGLGGIGSEKIVDVLDIVSPPSDWSAPVTTQKSTEFFFTSLSTNQAKMDVFHWEGGNWTRKNQSLSPGDRIPDSDWMIVDIHAAGAGGREREKYVLLSSDSGDVVRRSPSVDRGDPKLKALQDEVNPAAQPKDAGRGGGRTPAPSPPSAVPGQRSGVMPRGGG